MKSTFALIIILSLFLVSCGDEIDLESKVNLRPVRTMLVGGASTLNGRQFSAIVEADQHAQLSFGIGGKVETFNVAEGKKVKQGDVLAQLDATDVKISLTRLQADYDKASADYKRGQELVNSGVISRSDFDQIKAKYVNAESQLKAGKQNLKYTKIIAPFDGVVVERFVKEFEEVNSKQEIVELQDLSNLLIKINVPEKVMQNARRYEAERKFHVRFDNYKDRKFQVKLKEAVTRADETSQTYEVTFSLPETKDIRLFPGMTGLLIVEQAVTLGNGFIIPANTVLSDSQGKYVYLLSVDEQQKALVKRVNINVGNLTKNGLKVLSGLNQEDRLITAGMSQLVDGMQVKVPADLKQSEL